MRLNELDAYRLIDDYCNLPLIDVGRLGGGPMSLSAIFGCSATEASFKSILGLGLLILARERELLSPGQPVIESTSGSLGAGLALAGRVLGHPIHLVSDRNIPVVTRRKIDLLGAELHLVHEPHSVGGMQQSRDEMLSRLLAENPDFYWTNQNDSELNPLVYERWLVPGLEKQITFDTLAAGVFCVGSGGHFSAFATMLARHGIPSYVGDRCGSITFGGSPGASVIRGSGNQNQVPGVIDRARNHVSGVFTVDDTQAAVAVQTLAANGIFVGGSSGVCYAAAEMLAHRLGDSGPRRDLLTFFPDRGELYGDTFLQRTGT